MGCDYMIQNKVCSPACEKYQVPCSMVVKNGLFSDPVLTVVLLAVLVLMYLL